MNDILIRFTATAALAAIAAAIWTLVRRLAVRRAANAADGLEGYRRGKAALVYFSSPVCGPCLAVQHPAVQRFKNTAGSAIQVIEVDASARPDVAERWGVFSVPTTVFVDDVGRARAVNPGLISAEALLRQARLLRLTL